MKNFTKNDSGFQCINCGREVPPLKYSSRNHCPYCLHSLHVDVMPGDRANTCRGVLKPINVELNGKRDMLWCINVKNAVLFAETKQPKMMILTRF